MSIRIKRILFFVLILLPCFSWMFIAVDGSIPFEYNVPKYAEIRIFESNQFYYWIHLFTIVPVLLLSFDKKVAFYKTWKTLLPAILIIAVGFIFWDILFTKWNVWGFNQSYFCGTTIAGLPLEELLFFLFIPLACFFIHECLIQYFPKDSFKSLDKVISIGLGSILLVLGLFFFQRIYTSTAFLMAGVALLSHYMLFTSSNRSYFYRTFLIVLIPFLIVDGALTGGFSLEPIVLYNRNEFIGIRLVSVPIEDAIYGLLLLFLIYTIRDWMNGGKQPVELEKSR